MTHAEKLYAKTQAKRNLRAEEAALRVEERYRDSLEDENLFGQRRRRSIRQVTIIPAEEWEQRTHGRPGPSGERFVRSDASDQEIYRQTLLHNSNLPEGSPTKEAAAELYTQRAFGLGPTPRTEALERVRSTPGAVELELGEQGSIERMWAIGWRDERRRIVRQDPISAERLERAFFQDDLPTDQREAMDLRLAPPPRRTWVYSGPRG